MTCREWERGPTHESHWRLVSYTIGSYRGARGPEEAKDGRFLASKPEQLPCSPEDKHLGQAECERGWYQAKKWEEMTDVNAISCCPFLAGAD